eukprot:1137601-Pelagomonas_calceolata.AAC.5
MQYLSWSLAQDAEVKMRKEQEKENKNQISSTKPSLQVLILEAAWARLSLAQLTLRSQLQSRLCCRRPREKGRTS